MKDQEKDVRSKKVTPAVRGPKKKHGVPQKSLDGSLQQGTSEKLQEDILRENSAAEAAALRESQAEIAEDEESKEHPSFKERYAAVRAATLAAQLDQASTALNEGLRRVEVDGVINSAFVDEIQQREIEIANQLKNMIEKYENQVDVVTENSKIVEDDFEALSFSAHKINIDTKKTIVAPETLDKIEELLTEVKEIQPKIVAEARTRQTALFTLPDEQLLALSEQPEIGGNAEKLLTLMGNVVAEAQAAVSGLNTIATSNFIEYNFIANSIVANKELIEQIGVISAKLIKTIDTQDPKLEVVSGQMASNLQEMIETFKAIDMEHARNLKPTSVIMNAIDIQVDKAARLETIHEEAGEIVQDIEARNLERTLHETLKQMNHEPQYPELRRQFKMKFLMLTK